MKAQRKEVIIEVIGPETECDKCRVAMFNVKRAVSKLGLRNVKVMKRVVNDPDVIRKYGALITPTIAINGVVRIIGRVPLASEIEKLIVGEIKTSLTTRIYRAAIPLSLLVFSTAHLIYSKILAYSLAPTMKPQVLRGYPLYLIPLVYLYDYISHAWSCLLFAFVLAGLLTTIVPKDKVLAYLSSRKPLAYVIAAFSAPILTVCSCVMVPLFTSLVYSGAGIGPAITFLLMAPAANILTIILTSEIVSWKIALARFLFALLGSIIIGYLVSKTPWAKTVEEKFQSKVRKIKVREIVLTFDEKLWEGLRQSAFIAKLILPYLILGVAIVSYVEALLPPEIVATYLRGILGIVLGSIIGVPTYTPTLVEVVLVRALKNLGMSPAAALAFLIGGPMTSVPSMLAVSRVTGWKVVISYASLAVVLGIIAGLTYDFTVSSW